MCICALCVHAACVEAKRGVGCPQPELTVAVSSYLGTKNITQVLWKSNQVFLMEKPSPAPLTHAAEFIGQLCVVILSIFMWDPEI